MPADNTIFLMILVCSLPGNISGIRRIVELSNRISVLEVEDKNVSLTTAEKNKDPASRNKNALGCGNETFISELEALLGGSKNECNERSGGRIAKVFEIILNGDQHFFAKTDCIYRRGVCHAAGDNSAEVAVLEELREKKFPHMPKYKGWVDGVYHGQIYKYIVTEFLLSPQWTSLENFLFFPAIANSTGHKYAPMGWDAALRGFQLIVDVVDDLNQLGISHCDLHHGNIMVRGDASHSRIDEVKLIDFGMALHHNANKLCQQGMVHSDFQRLRILFFELLENPNPNILTLPARARWQKIYQEAKERGDGELTDEEREEYILMAAPDVLANRSFSAGKWWDKEVLQNKNPEIISKLNCKLCQDHAEDIMAIFEGSIGKASTRIARDLSDISLIRDLRLRLDQMRGMYHRAQDFFANFTRSVS